VRRLRSLYIRPAVCIAIYLFGSFSVPVVVGVFVDAWES